MRRYRNYQQSASSIALPGLSTASVRTAACQGLTRGRAAAFRERHDREECAEVAMKSAP